MNSLSKMSETNKVSIFLSYTIMSFPFYENVFFQHDTTKKTKKQKEANISKKKELDGLHEQLVHSEHDLSEIRKVIFYPLQCFQ